MRDPGRIPPPVLLVAESAIAATSASTTKGFKSSLQNEARSSKLSAREIEARSLSVPNSGGHQIAPKMAGGFYNRPSPRL